MVLMAPTKTSVHPTALRWCRWFGDHRQKSRFRSMVGSGHCADHLAARSLAFFTDARAFLHEFVLIPILLALASTALASLGTSVALLSHQGALPSDQERGSRADLCAVHCHVMRARVIRPVFVVLFDLLEAVMRHLAANTRRRGAGIEAFDVCLVKLAAVLVTALVRVFATSSSLHRGQADGTCTQGAQQFSANHDILLSPYQVR
jgi:hypothetical protein